MIAASSIRAAGWSAGTALAAVLAASLLFLDGAHAQQQPANPALKQFGPRVSQAPGQQLPKPELIATHGAWAVQCQSQSQSQSQSPGAGTGSEGDQSAQAASADTAGSGAEGGTGERACGIFQTVRHEQRQGVALTLVLVQGEQEGKPVTMMRVMAPIGVYLPTGVALEIDGDAVGRVPFTRCLPQACVAIAEASPPTLEKMKKGGKANFIIYEAPGSGIAMELSLQGFTAALGELDKL